MRNLLKAKYIIPIFVALIFVYFSIQNFQAWKDLKHNGIMVSATIIEFLGSSKGGSGSDPGYCCEFIYKGERKSSIIQSNVKSKTLSYIGRTFPALYSEKTKTVRLLM